MNKRKAAFLKGIAAKEKGAGIKTVAFPGGESRISVHCYRILSHLGMLRGWPEYVYGMIGGAGLR